LQQGLQREQMLILRLLTRRVGNLPEAVRSRVEALPLNNLESLGEALLDFQQLADLLAWLETAERE
jgi:Domain of unknown function (DUF4351)